MEKKRPVNLNLLTIKFPCTAIASILHRISGVILFLCIPLMLGVLAKSLHSEAEFASLQQCLTTPFAKLVIWLFLAAIIYHLIAGVRHIVMDMGIAETLKGGRAGAYIVMILSAILIILVGIWLC